MTSRLEAHRVSLPDVDPAAQPPLFAPGELARILLSELRLLVGLSVAVYLLGLTFLIVRTPRYVAESRMHPKTTDGGMSRFAGLAAQFGVALPGGGAGGDPLKLYVELLGSNQLLRDALKSRFTVATEPGARDSLRGPLIDLLRIPGETEQERIENGVEKLKKITEVSANEGAGTIRLRVVTRFPELSEKLNRRMLELLNEGTLGVRRAQAGGERQFVESRLLTAQQELAEAEYAVQRFLEVNRSYENSPQLRGEYDRLRRRVDLRQQVSTSLAQSYEQSRIDEMRNTPVLSILDPPEMTAVRIGRPRDAVVWLVFGFVLAVGVAIAREAARRKRAVDPLYFADLRSALRTGLRRLTFRSAGRSAGA